VGVDEFVTIIMEESLREETVTKREKLFVDRDSCKPVQTT
jgi:hypothetical protein